MQQVSENKRKLDLNSLLQSLPKFDALPARAPEKNYRSDGKKSVDQSVRSWQQCLLHAARMHTCMYMGLKADVDKTDLVVLVEQQFQYLAEIYHE